MKTPIKVALIGLSGLVSVALITFVGSLIPKKIIIEWPKDIVDIILHRPTLTEMPTQLKLKEKNTIKPTGKEKSTVPHLSNSNNNPQVSDKQNINGEQFKQTLKEARILLGNNIYNDAYQRFKKAYDILPDNLRKKVNNDSIQKAQENYSHNRVPVAAKEFAEAFNDIPTQ